MCGERMITRKELLTFLFRDDIIVTTLAWYPRALCLSLNIADRFWVLYNATCPRLSPFTIAFMANTNFY